MAAPRRIRRRYRRRWLALAVLVGLVGTRSLHDGLTRRSETAIGSLTPGEYEIVRVVDAGTLLVARPLPGNGRTERARVRLLGVNIPDGETTVAAERFTRDFVNGARIRLRLDRRRIADDGAFVAYCFVGDRMLNAELVRQGLATSATHPADAGEIVRSIERAQTEARENRRGVWKPPS